jgi:hypothetical protein
MERAQLRLVANRIGVGIAPAGRDRMNVGRRDRDMADEKPMRDAEIAARIVVRHVAVVAPEQMDALPRQCVAIGRLGQELIEPFRRRAAGEAERDAALGALEARRDALRGRARQRLVIGNNRQIWML